MIYNFDAINSDDTYKNCRVMFATGQYHLFNRIVSDELRKRTIDELDYDISDDEDLIKEFGIDILKDVKVSNTVDMETFINVINSPSINGKWFTSVDLGTLTKKQYEWLKEYIKNPSDNGILVITSVSYKDYRVWLKHKLIVNNSYVHLIQLSFPRRDALKLLVNKLFEQRGVHIDPNALDLFVLRMSSAYDDYEQVINKICASVTNTQNEETEENTNSDITISYDIAFNALKGIENFVIEDFIQQLTVPLPSANPKKGSVIFRMLGYLLEEYGERGLVNTLKNKIAELIDFRLAINKGYIPIIINGYNIDESKKLIEEDTALAKIAEKSDFQFRKLAKLASRTSFIDWYYMYLILSNVSKFNENSYTKVLYTLIFRSVLNKPRLDNDIGVESLLSYDLNFLNKVPYYDIGVKENDEYAGT